MSLVVDGVDWGLAKGHIERDQYPGIVVLSVIVDMLRRGQPFEQIKSSFCAYPRIQKALDAALAESHHACDLINSPATRKLFLVSYARLDYLAYIRVGKKQIPVFVDDKFSHAIEELYGN